MNFWGSILPVIILITTIVEGFRKKQNNISFGTVFVASILCLLTLIAIWK